ncbi:hypothetical protein ABT120_44835 [Nonomuraea angiospora]
MAVSSDRSPARMIRLLVGLLRDLPADPCDALLRLRTEVAATP